MSKKRLYIKGYETYGYVIREMRGWLDDTSVDSNGHLVCYIQADDNYMGARGTVLSTEYGNIEIIKETPMWWKDAKEDNKDVRNNNRVFNKGDKVKHFKDGVYEIDHYAIDCETCRSVVIYKDESTGLVWVRDQEVFYSKVPEDRKADQTYRFEKITTEV